MNDIGKNEDSPKAERAPWGDFPPIISNGPLKDLEKEPEYRAAKAGDWEAAITMTDRLITDRTIEEVKRHVGGDKQVKIVPVLAKEQQGSNKIPLAAAEILADRLGLEVEYNIIQDEKVYRTNSGSDHRLAYSPAFVGEVEIGRSYLILDDTLTTGGTLASLRGHIENRRGYVIGGVAMTAHPGALDIAVKPKMLTAIERNHGSSMNEYWKEEFGYEIDQLTQGEAGHLKNAASVDAIRERILAARDAYRRRTDESLVESQKGPEPVSNENVSGGHNREKADDFRNLPTKELMEKYPDNKAILNAVAIRGVSQKLAEQLPNTDARRQFVENTTNQLAYNIENGRENSPLFVKGKNQDNDFER